METIPPHDAALGGLRQRHHQNVVGHIQIRLGDDEATLAHGLLIPATGTRVITVAVDGGIGVIHLAAAFTKIGELEAAGDLSLLQGIEGLDIRLVAQRLDDVAAGTQPVADTLCLLVTQALHLFLTALKQQVFLAGIALPGEQQDHQGESDHHR